MRETVEMRYKFTIKLDYLRIMYHWKRQKRIESLQQQNRVLKCELETYKLRVKSLQEENKAIRQASVHIVSFVALEF